MKQKIKLNRYQWHTVIIALYRCERESVSDAFKKMFRDVRDEIENKLGMRKRVHLILEVKSKKRYKRKKDDLCEICGLHKATTEIDFGLWKGKKVCEVCYHNYWVISESVT